ncbi:MAG: metalloregulator ArsR/SmtB family transcription factor [Acidobacteria bacterium]|nr:metalloregulator ArsR/SmtB family transcription factor [Acidobacteriota bacterium]
MSYGARVLRVMGEETRLRILRLLLQSPLNVGELTQVLGLAQPTVSKHLAQLRQAGLVEGNRASAFNYYHVSDEFLRLWNPVLAAVNLTAEHDDQVRLRTVLSQRQERGESPDRFVVPGRSWAAWTRSLQYLLPPLRVADFGCGDGTFVREIAAWARKVVAIDSNRLLLGKAKQRCRGLKNVEFRLESMQEVSLLSRSIDLVVISQALHYLPEPERALTEAWRVLVAGGRLIILDLLPHQEQWVAGELRHRWLGFPTRTLRKWLHAIGFGKIQCERVAKETGPPFRVVIATGLKK